MNSLKNLFFALIVSLVLPQILTAQHHQEGGMAKHKTQAVVHYDASEIFQNQLKGVFEAYIDLKDALVASDAEQAAAKAKMVATQLQKVDDAGLDDDAKKAWEKWSATINEELAKILSNEDIKAQRMAFSDISDAMYHSVKSFGLKDLDAYHQFCPMANNGEGAHWMSEDKAIKNPYYGSKMMKCGKTVEEL